MTAAEGDLQRQEVEFWTGRRRGKDALVRNGARRVSALQYRQLQESHD